MMYVYFDTIGDIKSISPIEDADCNTNFKFALFPLVDVEPFLTAKESTFNFYIKFADVTDADVYTIERKYVPTINYIRSSSAFLAEVMPLGLYDTAGVSIHNDTKAKIIAVKIADVIIDYDLNTVSTPVNEFIQAPSVSLFFTKKHDPYFLLCTVSIVPANLLNGNIVYVPYVEDLSNVSVYVSDFKGSYSYSETY